MELTQEEVRALFSYSRKTGLLIRRFSRGKAPAGTHSTSKDRDGYLVIGINGKLYRAHRVIWLYVYGKWPDNDIDHKNRIKDDNRIKNLRDVTRSQNKQNQTVTKSNKCGIKGVWLHSQTLKWCASICISGKNHHIGSFTSKKAASEAYRKSASKLHEFNPSARVG